MPDRVLQAVSRVVLRQGAKSPDPLLQNYGDVFFVEDPTSRGTQLDDSYYSQDYRALPGLLRGNSCADDEWKDRVRQYLHDSDVAVIDISVLSASVLWEINESYSRFPAHRILFVASADAFREGVIDDLLPNVIERRPGRARTARNEPVALGG
jgi:hypothetical protein